MSLGRLTLQLVAIVVAGVPLGLALNAASPRPVALGVAIYPTSDLGGSVCAATAPEGEAASHAVMPLREALAACAACAAAFVDARPTSAFEQGHVAGAIHLPRGNPDELHEAIEHLRAFETIVVYDDDVGCELATGVADMLRQAGFADVRVLEGTWTDWQAAQGPAQAGSCETCALHGGHG